MKTSSSLKRKTPLKRSNFKSKTLNTTKTVKRTRKKKSPLKKLKIKLWELCKQITRERYGNVCYTCYKSGLEGSNWHTGHFIPSSICSTEMRYSLDNLRPQCYRCNVNLSGNWPEYEKHLLADGVDIQKLKDINEQTKNEMYREDWYEAKIAEYTRFL